MVFKVVRAFTEALHFIETNKEETKALIAKNLKANDPEGLELAYRAYNAAFPEVPYPNAEGVKTLLDDIAPVTPKAPTADSKSFVDLSIVKELDSSQLYKTPDRTCLSRIPQLGSVVCILIKIREQLGLLCRDIGRFP